MKINYRLRPLSHDEQEFLTMVLFKEIEIQSWFAVSFSFPMNEEVFLTLQ